MFDAIDRSALQCLPVGRHLGIPLIPSVPRQLTVQQIGMRYYEGHVRQRWGERGAREVWRIFARTLGEFGQVAAHEINEDSAGTFLSTFLDRPIQGSITRRELGAAWDYAIKQGWLPPDTVNVWRLVLRGAFKSKGVRVKGVHRGPRKRLLSVAELAVLLPWLRHFTSANEDILTLFAWTCAPGKDICAMHASQISQEPDGWWWTIPQDKLRARRRDAAMDHRVPLVGRALEIVRRRLQASSTGYLFEGRKGGGFDPKNVGVAVWNAREDCESRPDYQRPRLPISDWTPNDLRRSTAQLLLALECPQEMVDAVQGCQTRRLRLANDRHSDDALRRLWLTRLAQVLEPLMQGRLPAPWSEEELAA
ncbi:hypothetical protein J2S30_000814 [Herbaspirillum rubrisubalbicans]|uniref:alpha/beta hydrolase n=1 Tax=Herbaspirillum rubrisubalbicans TaxID=80842 RepID=UPI00209DDCB1|nr:alpha/beta hydrolase [Herbaspirillum rubrisubalbicans]MCP1572435.1 hypothetical protein [Herbaspirillum rubrisubalbicans]